VGIDFNSNEARVVLINSEKTEFVRKLLTDFVTDISQYRGNLTAEHLNRVIQEINKAKTVTARDKQLVGCDWTPQDVKRLLDSL